MEGLYLLHKHLDYSSVKGRKGVCERNSKGDELDNEAGVQVSFIYDTTLLIKLELDDILTIVYQLRAGAQGTK